MTLYELTGQLLELMAMAEDPDVPADTLADTMEAVQGEFATKAEGYAMVLRNLDAEAKALQAEADRMQKKADAITANAKRIKERLKAAMEATGQCNFKSGLFHFYLKRNTAALVIDNPEEISPEYLIPQPPKVDKNAIKEDLKAGVNLPWCHTEQGMSLMIK